MSSTPKRHYYSSAAATRPDISPEEEAKLCALPLILVRDLHKRLENSEPGPSLREAIDDCVKWLSIPLTEAAPILELPLKKTLKPGHGNSRRLPAQRQMAHLDCSHQINR